MVSDSEDFIKRRKAPVRKYENDIKELLVFDHQLWVKTLTVDKNRGRLYDVFDFEGHYLDCFYLPSEIDPCCLEKDILYGTKTEPDGRTAVIKYKISPPKFSPY